MVERSRIVLARLGEQANSPVDLFDAEKYLRYIDDCDLTEVQKVDFLNVLWDIMSAFVDLGFGVDSVLPILMNKVKNGDHDVVQYVNQAQKVMDADNLVIQGDCP